MCRSYGAKNFFEFDGYKPSVHNGTAARAPVSKVASPF
jgi:hypothetical protein